MNKTSLLFNLQILKSKKENCERSYYFHSLTVNILISDSGMVVCDYICSNLNWHQLHSYPPGTSGIIHYKNQQLHFTEEGCTIHNSYEK